MLDMGGNKRTFSVLGILSIAILFTFSATTSAYAVPILNPANGNYYDLVIPGGFPLWTTANDAANAATITINGNLVTDGHLVTIT